MTESLNIEKPNDTTVSSETSLSGGDAEKGPTVRQQVVNLDRAGETGGYVLDEEKLREHLGLAPDAVLKKTKNGRLVLIPQPSDDPRDPLNWPEWKKNLILLMLALNACTGDYSASTGASALIPQAQEWHISPNTVNHATAGTTFMLGAGGLFVVWLSAYIGRLPVLFWCACLSTGTAAWMAAARSFESYMAARILNGTFAIAAAAGGLMWIKDVWFFHEHPRKINIWSNAITLSPLLGPQFMAAIISVDSWRTGIWLDFGIIALGLVLVILLGRETFYPRHLPADEIHPPKSRVLQLIGVEQARTHYTTNSLIEAGSRLWFTLIRLPVFLTCLYYFIDFPWTIANNTTISVFIIPVYNFDFRNLAALLSAPVVTSVLALISGHWIFDFIGNWYAKRHNGRIEPEARLIILWFMLPLKVVGYNLIGASLQQHWSYWVLVVGWGMHNFATVMTTTALGAYLIDAYPDATGECAAWLNFARTAGGFIVGYVQINWAVSEGTQDEYGIQSAMMVVAFFVVIYLQFYGKQLRHSCGPLKFKTN